jgi:hypothetical protein
MRQNPKHSNAIAYLRQLCCSGLDKEIVIPEFLRAIQSVIPSSSNTFSGVDAQLNNSFHITEFVSTEIDEVTPLVISSYYTPQRLLLVANWFKQHPVLVDSLVLDELFYQSDMYNLVYRRFDQHHLLIAPVLIGGIPAGICWVYIVHGTKNPSITASKHCVPSCCLMCHMHYVSLTKVIFNTVKTGHQA